MWWAAWRGMVWVRRCAGVALGLAVGGVIPFLCAPYDSAVWSWHTFWVVYAVEAGVVAVGWLVLRWGDFEHEARQRARDERDRRQERLRAERRAAEEKLAGPGALSDPESRGSAGQLSVLGR